MMVRAPNLQRGHNHARPPLHVAICGWCSGSQVRTSERVVLSSEEPSKASNHMYTRATYTIAAVPSAIMAVPETA